MLHEWFELAALLATVSEIGAFDFFSRYGEAEMDKVKQAAFCSFGLNEDDDTTPDFSGWSGHERGFGQEIYQIKDIDDILTRSWEDDTSSTYIKVCAGEVKYVSHINYIYYGTLLGSHKVDDELKCVMKCYGHPYCESANFDKEIHMCELNAEKKSPIANSNMYRLRFGMNYLEQIQCTESSSHRCGFAGGVATRMSAASLSYTQNPADAFSRLSEVRPNSFPWVVSVQLDNVHICSGALISAVHVVTAASCFTQSRNAVRYKALLGAHSLTTADAGQQLIPIGRIIVHEYYKPERSRENDIALLRLKEAPRRTTGIGAGVIQNICLPPALSMMAPSYCMTVGWGHISLYSHVDSLSQLVTPIIRRFDCNKPLWYDGQVVDSMLCAGRFDASPCQPDGGGPLICSSVDNVWVLVGVGSWGEGCARQWKPAVYTSVAYYQRWINRKAYIE